MTDGQQLVVIPHPSGSGLALGPASMRDVKTKAAGSFLTGAVIVFWVFMILRLNIIRDLRAQWLGKDLKK